MKTPTVEITKGLANIRQLRRIFLTVLFTFPLVVAGVTVWMQLSNSRYPMIVLLALFFGGMFIQNRLHKHKCPGCHDFFFVQTVTKENYTPYSSISFPPQKKCQNCGLVLYN
jgi:hypothetical protein